MRSVTNVTCRPNQTVIQHFDNLDIMFSNFKVYILNVETLNDRSEENLKKR